MQTELQYGSSLFTLFLGANTLVHTEHKKPTQCTSEKKHSSRDKSELGEPFGQRLTGGERSNVQTSTIHTLTQTGMRFWSRTIPPRFSFLSTATIVSACKPCNPTLSYQLQAQTQQQNCAVCACVCVCAPGGMGNEFTSQECTAESGCFYIKTPTVCF